MSVTNSVTTNTTSLSLFDQALAHSILHMSTGWHLILIGHHCSAGVWSPRQKCLNSACETWACPQGHFSLGGESKTDKHKQQEFQFWPRPSGVMPLWRTHQTGSPVCLAPVGPDPIPDRSQEKLASTSSNAPPFQPVNKLGEVGPVYVPTLMLPLTGQSWVTASRLFLFLIILWLWLAWEI